MHSNAIKGITSFTASSGVKRVCRTFWGRASLLDVLAAGPACATVLFFLAEPPQLLNKNLGRQTQQWGRRGVQGEAVKNGCCCCCCWQLTCSHLFDYWFSLAARPRRWRWNAAPALEPAPALAHPRVVTREPTHINKHTLTHMQRVPGTWHSASFCCKCEQ